MKRLDIVLLCLLTMTLIISMLIISGCAEKKEIKIGAILPLTGPDAYLGESTQEGIEVAVDEINSAGGIMNKKMKIIYEDTQEKSDVGISAFRKLITVDKVSIVIGALASSVTLAIAPIAENNKVILISPASTSPEITNAGDYIFRICPSDVFEGRKMAEFVYSQEIKKVAILYINNDYGLGLANEFKKKISEHGIAISMMESFEQGSQDFRTSLLKIKNKNPEAIYLIGYPPEIIQVIKQAKELDLNSQILTSYEFENPEIIKSLGKLADGVIYTAYAYDPSREEPIVQNFIATFRAKNNEDPNIFVAMGYDATKVIAQAINNADTMETSKIKDELYNIKNFAGVTGEITFDKNGDVTEKTIAIKTVKDQKFVYYER